MTIEMQIIKEGEMSSVLAFSKHNKEKVSLDVSILSQVSLGTTSLHLNSRVAQRSKALHLSVRGVTTDTLVRFQAVSQPAVIGSIIGRCTIGPASSEFGRCRPSF